MKLTKVDLDRYEYEVLFDNHAPVGYGADYPTHWNERDIENAEDFLYDPYCTEQMYEDENGNPYIVVDGYENGKCRPCVWVRAKKMTIDVVESDENGNPTVVTYEGGARRYELLKDKSMMDKHKVEDVAEDDKFKVFRLHVPEVFDYFIVKEND